MTQTPSIGRIVLYKLSEQDAQAINRRRTDYEAARRAKYAPGKAAIGTGEQVHVGNDVQAGDVFPAIVVRVWPTSVQLQVFLDGNDTFWATSVNEGDGERQWSWPPRV